MIPLYLRPVASEERTFAQLSLIDLFSLATICLNVHANDNYMVLRFHDVFLLCRRSLPEASLVILRERRGIH